MKSASVLILIAFSFVLPSSVLAQRKKTPAQVPSRPPLLVRTTTRNEVRRFAFGGTVTVVGAPEGSITIEGWPRDEVSITADIQLRADTESDLALLATVNNIVLDVDMNHLSVLTTGTHDRAFMRVAAKKFPKTLLGLPWKVDYRIRVPQLTDLEINAGRGPIKLAGVEGNIRLSITEGETNLTLSGGTLSATVAGGKLNLTIPTKSWRGVGAEVRLASGEVNLELPAGFNGDIDAEILQVGQIADTFGLQPREEAGITPRKVKARAGAGGAAFQLTVGVGAIYIRKQQPVVSSQ